MSWSNTPSCLNTPKSERGNWSTRTIGILALLMVTIGYGDIISFPYHLLHNKIIFLVPCVILYFLIGLPLYTLELIVGQYQNLGPTKAFYNLAPILAGVGPGMAINSVITCIYYNVYIAASLLLFWNYIQYIAGYVTMSGDITSIIEDFLFPKDAFMPLESSALFWAYSVAWLLAVLCILKGVQASEKVIVFTNVIPCFLLFVVLALVLFGYSGNGADSYVYDITAFIDDVDLNDLKHLELWTTATKFVVFDLSLGFGALSTISSYNRTSTNCILDAFIIPIIGFVLSSICLFLVSDSYDVAEGKSPFLVILCSYYDTFTIRIAGLLYAMFFFKGLGSQILMMETMSTAVFDQFPSWRKKCHARVVGFGGFALWIFGTSLCLIPGIFELIARASMSLNLFMALVLSIAGPFASFQFEKMKTELKMNVPKIVGIYLRSCWICLTPLSLASAWTLVVYKTGYSDAGGIVLKIIIVIILLAITTIQCRDVKQSLLFKPTDIFCLEVQRRPIPQTPHNCFQMCRIDNISISTIRTSFSQDEDNSDIISQDQND